MYGRACGMSAMTQTNFDTSLGLTLVYEGGWVNNPNDPGGATYKGVTQAVYDDDRDRRKVPRQSVRLMTDAELRAIYRWRYWDMINGDSLPLGVDYAAFDFAVNSGVARSARALQGIVHAVQDGQIGPITIQAIVSYSSTYGVSALTDALCNARMAFLQGLPTFATFGQGWTRRVMGAQPGHQAGDTGVIDRAYDMAAGNSIAAPANVLATIKTYNAGALGAAA
jgi:lysozyme family protein